MDVMTAERNKFTVEDGAVCVRLSIVDGSGAVAASSDIMTLEKNKFIVVNDEIAISAIIVEE